jgi:aminoglycoside 2''-phosphotransferase
MTGVIDFGSATLGDPANDVAALLTYGEPFVRQGLASYPAMEAMLPRARFYLRTFPLQDALYGVEHNDADAFADGIARFLR